MRRRETALLALVWTLGALVSPGVSGDDRTDRIDAFLRRHLEEIPGPGFSAVVVEGDRVVFQRGYGVERVGHSAPLTDRSSIAIGSQTKSLTAVAVLQLAEAGRVDLDSPVTRYLPWFRTADGRQDEVTLRTLLHNSSGIPSRDRWLYSRDRGEEAIERGVRSLSLEPLVRAPGRSFEYANENWSILGLVISEVSGRSYSGYLEESVLAPLEMRRSTTALARFADIGVLHGHYTGVDAVRPARPRFLAGALPAGSELRSTAEDMGHYLVMLLNGGVYRGRRLLSEASVDRLFEPGIRFTVNMPEMGLPGGEAGYAMGWIEATIDGRVVHHHGGDAIVMGSWTMLDRARELGVSVLFNGPSYFEYRFPSRVWVANNLLHLAAGEPISDFGLPVEDDPTANDYELPPERLAGYTGTYLSSQGLRAEIAPSEPGRRLRLTMLAGDIEYEYEIDFASEAAAVMRNLSGALPARFLLTPDGEVTGLEGLPGGPFRRRSAAEIARLHYVASPAGRLRFAVPRELAVTWEGAEFEVLPSTDAGWSLRGGVVPAADRAAVEAARQAILRDGAHQATETIGGRMWSKLVWTRGAGPGATQALWMTTEEAGEEMLLRLTTPAGELTAVLRDVLFPLLSDLQLR